jgi:hypothetical protein
VWAGPRRRKSLDLGDARTDTPVDLFMAGKTSSDQVFYVIVSERAAKAQMMNLQLGYASTMLTPPTVAI